MWLYFEVLKISKRLTVGKNLLVLVGRTATLRRGIRHKCTIDQSEVKVFRPALGKARLSLINVN
jgi:hypothetical protein